MNKTFHLQIWAAKCCGSEKNCLYPDAATVTDTETLRKMIAKDHTFIQCQSLKGISKNPCTNGQKHGIIEI